MVLEMLKGKSYDEKVDFFFYGIIVCEVSSIIRVIFFELCFCSLKYKWKFLFNIF